MTLFRTVAPAAEPVGVAEAKAYLRIAHDSEDALLEGLIRAAREEVEARAGVALLTQCWRLALDRWPAAGRVRLKPHPVVSVDAVIVYGADGEAELLPASGWRLDAHSRPARLEFVRRPEPARTMNGIEIDFTAGFGDEAEAVPERLRQAMLRLVAHWFEFRASFGADEQPVSLPPDFERFVSGFRRMRL